MDVVNNEGIGLSWEETGARLAPTPGTALELLSTDSPGAVTRVLCLRRPPPSGAFARRAVNVLFSSVTRSGADFCSWIMDEWRHSSLDVCCRRDSSPLSYIWCILCYSRGVSQSLCTSVKWYIYNKCKPLMEALECIRLYKLHHNQPLFVEFCTNPDGRISFWKCCQSSVDCRISRSCCYFNCIAVQVTTGILEKLSEVKNVCSTIQKVLWR